MSGGKAKKRKDKQKARPMSADEILLWGMLEGMDVWHNPETGEIRFSEKEEEPVSSG